MTLAPWWARWSWITAVKPYSFYRGFVLLPSKIVLLDLLLGAILGLRRWPTPLGPPTDLMPGHLSPARGRTTLNATHLRAGQVADPAPSASLAIVSSTSARPSTPVVLRAWSRSLLGGQALGSGEAMGRVAGGAEPTQQLGGLQRHGTNYYRRAVAIRWQRRNIGATILRCCCIAAAWCGTFQ